MSDMNDVLPLDKASEILAAIDDGNADHTVDQAIALAQAYATVAQAQALVNVADAISGLGEFDEYFLNKLAAISESLQGIERHQSSR